MRLTILAAAALALGVAPAASAAPTVDTPLVRASLALAQAHWGAAPTCPVHVTLEVWPGARAEDAGAWSESPSCQFEGDTANMLLSPTEWPGYYARRPVDGCRLIAHEWGHLLSPAYDNHTDSGLMRADTGTGADAPLCEAFRDRWSERQADRFERLYQRARERTWKLEDRSRKLRQQVRQLQNKLRAR